MKLKDRDNVVQFDWSAMSIWLVEYVRTKVDSVNRWVSSFQPVGYIKLGTPHNIISATCKVVIVWTFITDLEAVHPILFVCTLKSNQFKALYQNEWSLRIMNGRFSTLSDKRSNCLPSWTIKNLYESIILCGKLENLD